MIDQAFRHGGLLHSKSRCFPFTIIPSPKPNPCKMTARLHLLKEISQVWPNERVCVHWRV